MAQKRFCLTSDGVAQPCKRAWYLFGDSCKATHYPTMEVAKEAEESLRQRRAKASRSDNLHVALQDFGASNKRKRDVFNFTRLKDSVRVFAEKADAHAAANGHPENIASSIGTFTLDNGAYKPVNVSIVRMPKVNEREGRIAGVWNLEMTTTLGRHLNFETVSKNLALQFGSKSRTRGGLYQAREFFMEAARFSGLFEEHDAEFQAQKMVEDLTSMMDAIESETEGDFYLWENGQGYFVDSDSENIVVDVDYLTSAFRGKNLKRFLRDNPYYETYTPAVQISVSEINQKTGTSWKLNRQADGNWDCTLSRADGMVQTRTIADATELRAQIYYDCFDHVHVGNKHESLRRSSFAQKLMLEVEDLLEANKHRVKNTWEEERKATEQRKLEVSVRKKRSFRF